MSINNIMVTKQVLIDDYDLVIRDMTNFAKFHSSPDLYSSDLDTEIYEAKRAVRALKRELKFRVSQYYYFEEGTRSKPASRYLIRGHWPSISRTISSI